MGKIQVKVPLTGFAVVTLEAEDGETVYSLARRGWLALDIDKALREGDLELTPGPLKDYHVYIDNRPRWKKG